MVEGGTDRERGEGGTERKMGEEGGTDREMEREELTERWVGREELTERWGREAFLILLYSRWFMVHFVLRIDHNRQHLFKLLF